MSRLTYFVILLLSYFDFFYVMPIGPLVEAGRGTLMLGIQMLVLMYGAYKWRYGKRLRLYTLHNVSFVWKLYISLIPSMFMAVLLFDQSWTQNIISYRNMLSFLAIPVLLKIGISDKDIIKGTWIFSFIFMFAAFWRTYVNFPLFYTPEDLEATFNSVRRGSVSEFLVTSPNGVQIMIYPLFYYCNLIIKRFSWKTFYRIAVLYVFIVLIQNRSILFPASIITAVSLLCMDSRHGFIKLMVIALSTFFILYFAVDIFVELLVQTDVEMSVSYDPRTIAREYFLDFKRLSWLEILFGTGIISFNTSNYVEMLQQSHIHYSDVGFIGMWAQLGIIPVLLFAVYLLKPFFTKRIPLYVKFVSCVMLVCSMTVSYFMVQGFIMWYVLYYYLFCYYNNKYVKRYI